MLPQGEQPHNVLVVAERVPSSFRPVVPDHTKALRLVVVYVAEDSLLQAALVSEIVQVHFDDALGTRPFVNFVAHQRG